MSVAVKISLAPDLAQELDRLAMSAQVTRDQIVEEVLRRFLEVRTTPLEEGDLFTMTEVLRQRSAFLSEEELGRKIDRAVAEVRRSRVATASAGGS